MGVIADLFLGGVAVAAPYLLFLAGLVALSLWLRARGRKDAAGSGRRRGAQGSRGGPPGALWQLLLPVLLFAGTLLFLDSLMGKLQQTATKLVTPAKVVALPADPDR